MAESQIRVSSLVRYWAIPFDVRTPLSRIHVFISYIPEEFQAQKTLSIPEEFQAVTNSKLKGLFI